MAKFLEGEIKNLRPNYVGTILGTDKKNLEFKIFNFKTYCSNERKIFMGFLEIENGKNGNYFVEGIFDKKAKTLSIEVRRNSINIKNSLERSSCMVFKEYEENDNYDLYRGQIRLPIMGNEPELECLIRKYNLIPQKEGGKHHYGG